MNLMLPIIAMLIVGSVLLIFEYSKLVRIKNKVEENWRNIEVQLKRRYDLLPSLLEMLEGYTNREKTIFKEIETACNQGISAVTVPEQASAEKVLSQSLKSLFAISENYPDLKSSENFRNLQQRLSDVEDEIQIARRYYNATVLENNNRVRSFPGILIAGPLRFEKIDSFDMNVAEKEMPKIKF